MKFGFVDGHRQVWPVRVMCAVLGFGRQPLIARLALSLYGRQVNSSGASLKAKLSTCD
ncbi:hypothetical protein QE389_000014 [Brevundimonas sp. SORGH_AS 993]|nr:hypothetical protein [Brevundimonas sp. SORGH_AS_0993]